MVKSEDIPAATRLFNLNGIVQQLVEGSIGRQWLQAYPDSLLKGQIPYCIESAEQETEVSGKPTGMVHAQPPHDWHLLHLDDDSADRETLAWGRTRISQLDMIPVANIDAVVVGHTILEQPETLGNVHYIDTGAFHTGRLTLIEAREVLA